MQIFLDTAPGVPYFPITFYFQMTNGTQGRVMQRGWTQSHTRPHFPQEVHSCPR